MFRTDQEELSLKTALQFINDYKSNINRYKKLQDYYLGKHAILDREKDENQANNKIINNYPKYITDTITGYFMGPEVKYSAKNDKVKDFVDSLIEVFDLNVEKRENSKIAKTCSIKGDCYEILYVNKDSNIKFRKIEPETCFLIFDTSIENHLMHAVRFYENKLITDDGIKNIIKYVEIYDSKKVRYFEDTGDGYRLEDTKEHFFGEVPVVHFVNNEEGTGDFEHVISIIDAYNAAQSNTLNDMDDFSDAYLTLTNMLATDENEIAKAKRDKVILLDEDGKAEWLIKNVNDVWVENMKTRLNDDIHKFSFTPDMTDKNFGNNVSGVSLKYKLLGMEQLRKTKEGYFEQALKRRIRLISNLLNIKKNTSMEFAFKDIEIKFNNSLPQNELELAQVIQTLTPLLSEETLLGKLPDIDDPIAEMERKKKEEEENITNSMNMYQSLGVGHEEEQEVPAKEE